MALYVKKKGYSFGFCPTAVLYHDISRERLNTKYLNELWYKIGQGVFIASQNPHKIERIAYNMILYMRLLKYRVQSRTKYEFYRKYIKGYHDAERGK